MLNVTMTKRRTVNDNFFSVLIGIGSASFCLCTITQHLNCSPAHMHIGKHINWLSTMMNQQIPKPKHLQNCERAETRHTKRNRNCVERILFYSFSASVNWMRCSFFNVLENKFWNFISIFERRRERNENKNK